MVDIIEPNPTYIHFIPNKNLHHLVFFMNSLNMNSPLPRPYQVSRQWDINSMCLLPTSVLYMDSFNSHIILKWRICLSSPIKLKSTKTKECALIWIQDQNPSSANSPSTQFINVLIPKSLFQMFPLALLLCQHQLFPSLQFLGLSLPISYLLHAVFSHWMIYEYLFSLSLYQAANP